MSRQIDECDPLLLIYYLSLERQRAFFTFTLFSFGQFLETSTARVTERFLAVYIRRLEHSIISGMSFSSHSVPHEKVRALQRFTCCSMGLNRQVKRTREGFFEKCLGRLFLLRCAMGVNRTVTAMAEHMMFVSCVRYALGAQRLWSGQVKILRRGES